jgi:hypothetical protein
MDLGHPPPLPRQRDHQPYAHLRQVDTGLDIWLCGGGRLAGAVVSNASLNDEQWVCDAGAFRFQAGMQRVQSAGEVRQMARRPQPAAEVGRRCARVHGGDGVLLRAPVSARVPQHRAGRGPGRQRACLTRGSRAPAQTRLPRAATPVPTDQRGPQLGRLACHRNRIPGVSPARRSDYAVITEHRFPPVTIPPDRGPTVLAASLLRPGGSDYAVITPAAAKERGST